MLVRLKDLMAAEQALDEALQAREDYHSNPDSWWGAREELAGYRKTVVLSDSYFTRAEMLDAEVQQAEVWLRSLQQQFARGA